ncbi:hypothetical protein QAD02_000290 [Eretmocerus hayati]|uniref:Uncharacterized protein n=1 Tax=Eretmocerus hayati TaxID=131215 RepID=A0ACC2NDQ6_9HYME|nr:hypothetical protein QAD02_000290 [Eretmocerus hayati]
MARRADPRVLEKELPTFTDVHVRPHGLMHSCGGVPAGQSCSSSSGGPEVAPRSPGSHQQPQQQQQHQLGDDALVGKRLSAVSSPVDRRCSPLSDKSVSPVDCRRDACSPVDRRTSPIGEERRNGSRGASPTDKISISSTNNGRTRPCAPGLDRSSVRLGGSGGSVDSRSDSASPVGGCYQRSNSSGHDRLHLGRGGLLDPLRALKGSPDFVDGDVKTDDDNEPPGPAPSSRPCSPGHLLSRLGDPVVASRLAGGSSSGGMDIASARRIRLENERLVAEVARLRRLLLSGAARGEVGADEAVIEDEARYVALEMELQHVRDSLVAVKQDRKRLRAEKFDLLNQMKALYGTLEDKERELRDFIRNYEQRVRENESGQGRTGGTSSQTGSNPDEREMERERERWNLLRAARDEADRSLALAASLADKEAALAHAHATIKELRRQLNERNGGVCLSDQESLASFPRGSINGGNLACTPGSVQQQQQSSQLQSGSNAVGELAQVVGGGGSNAIPAITGQPGDRGSCSADSGVRGSSDRESGGATSIGGNLSDSTTDATTPKDCSPTLSPLNAFSRSMDGSSLSRSVEQLSSPMDPEPRRIKHQPNSSHAMPQSVHSRSSATRGGTWGSISRVFARSRHRKTSSSADGSGIHSGSFDGQLHQQNFDPYRSWSPLTEEGYAEKLRLLREAASVPMERWRAPTVLAWLEVALGMPQYGPKCAENVKSGKVLLELNDSELEAGLGMTHALHRKKLRLAIEEHRHPNLVRYPCIGQLGHTWVSSEWLPDLGLAQYAESFATNMVDARMLDHLSKKELEKLLGVTRKFHQASIVHGINLLRMLNYDRQALAVRRHNCESSDTDPLVWTNQRFIRWARNIDLAEYADNLKDSGVHGALVVLEPSFTGDTMATALGVPPAKHMIRRHLTAELEAIVLPARAQLEVVPRGGGPARPMSSLSGGSLGRGARALHIQQHPVQHQHSLHGLQQQQQQQQQPIGGTVDRRRCSLRGSLSRALGLRPRGEKASPSSSSDTGSLSSQYFSPGPGNHQAYQTSCSSPPPPQLPPRPATISGSTRRHRRVKSIGDIDYLGTGLGPATPPGSYGRPPSYSGYYSPQGSDRSFPGVQRYASLAEEAWPPTSTPEQQQRERGSGYRVDRVI